MALERYFTYDGTKSKWNITSESLMTLAYFTEKGIAKRRHKTNDQSVGLMRFQFSDDEFDSMGAAWFHDDFTPVDINSIDGKPSWNLWDAENDINRLTEEMILNNQEIIQVTALKTDAENRKIANGLLKDQANNKKSTAEAAIAALG